MIAGLIARARSLLRGMVNDPNAEMRAEFEHHLELRARDLVRSGLSPADAARQARVEFGGTYDHQEAGREARGLRWLDSFRISWIDMKLGARMVRRYPGLTLVGGLAMGVAIAIGAGVMGVITLLKDPSIPLDEGERIVGIQVWNTSSYNAVRMIGYDFLIWKAELTTVRDVGAFRNITRAIGANDGSAEPARGAEMSASGFRVARVSPLLGRYLIDDDELPGAPLVAVLGHDIWSSRFGSDSGIVGKSVKIGGIDHMVVGVMPPAYAWPINHNLWVPLRLDPATKPREGPVLYAFGRLAPGVSLEEARAEVAAIGDRTAAQLPAMRGDVRPHLMAFAQSWFELDSPETVMVFQAARAAVTLLLIIICVNIAILVYARTATRQAEIAVRSALGASRTRIVAQLVGEALVLAALGGVVALGLLSAVASQTDSIVQRTGASAVIPFWLKMGVSAETVAYLVLLAIFAALIVGVVPALQMTGRRVQANLQRLSGGHASVRMGKVWTALIVAEVAFTVAILPGAVFLSGESLKTLAGPGFPAERYLSAELGVNREPNETGADSGSRRFDERSTLLRDEVIRRILAEDNVRAVTYSAEIPGSESGSRIEIEGATAKFNVETDGGKVQFGWGENSHQVRVADVDYGYFETFQVDPIVGRTFRASDLLPGGGVVVVNRALADSLFRGGNPVGRKVRVLGYGDRGSEYRGAWLEVVGVVPSFPANVDFERPKLVMYTVVRHVQPALLSILVRDGNPSAFSSRLRAITSDVDPSMFLRNVQPLSETISATHLPLRLMTTGLLAVTVSVLILSSAGLYALMLVTVTQRRREIGIRIALGADRRQVLSGIFWRAALQVSGGIAIGITIALAAHWGDIRTEEFKALVILPAVSLFMLGVGVLASMGPARRGLAIQPSVVLKEE